MSSQYFDDPKLNSKVKDLIRGIKLQTMRGFKLITNIHKLCKLESSELQTQKIEVHDVLKNAIDFVKQSIQNYVSIKVNSSLTTVYIRANELLQDIFENILINAIVHNINPNIKILVKISKISKKGEKFLKLQFIDNGIGIDDVRKKEIFQIKKELSNNGKGMGFGLFLVRKLIRIYNGDIWVENKVKEDYTKGSKFILLIPILNS